MNETAERLDRDTIDYIMNEFRKDAVFVTAPELNAAIANFAKLVTSGKLHTPNRSGGANGPEIIAKIDAALGTDWKSGTDPEIIAVIEAAALITLTAAAVTGDLTMTGDLVVATKTPATAAATGTAGTIAWDAGFLYVCVGTDEWERVAIATW